MAVQYTDYETEQWEVFTPTRHRQSNPNPTLTIGKTGIVTLNRASFLALGEPQAVQLLYRPGQIGLRPVDRGTPNSYVLSGKASRIISMRSLLNHHNLEIRGMKLSAAMVDGVLTISI